MNEKPQAKHSSRVMSTMPQAIAAAFLLFFTSNSAYADRPEAADAKEGKLPALIREKEKGVFQLRILSEEGREISSGTGFLLDGKGTLVTALHVILPKSQVVGSVEAKDSAGKVWEVEGLIASDASVDLALLKLEKLPDGAVPLVLAGDELPEQGADVLVLGHPRGFNFVATNGIVSATHKTNDLPLQLLQSGFIHSAADVVWIQTTAPVDHGNSGGPLLDKSGDVIGIVQWMVGGQGLNFALQVAQIRELLAQPAKLQTFKDFSEPEADFFALMKDFQMDRMKQGRHSFFNEMPGGRKGVPADEPDPLLGEYVPALAALAVKHRGKDVELTILLTLMNISGAGHLPQEATGDVKKAAGRLLDEYRDDRRLLPFLQSRSAPSQPEVKDFFAALSKSSSDVGIRGLAALLAARSIDLNDKDVGLIDKAKVYARAAAECPSHIMYGPEPVADAAEKLIAMLEHGTRGCHAPELEGIDQDGKMVNLKELKGRHVVVVFYTEESDIRSGISKQLNEIAKYGEGRPLSVVGVLVEFPGRFFHAEGFRQVKKTWPVIKDDSDGSLREAWFIAESPTVFLIDPQSVILSRNTEPTGRQQQGMGFGGIFGRPGSSESEWKRELLDELKAIPELESEVEKRAKLPMRLSSNPIDPSLLKGLVLRYTFDKEASGMIPDASGKGRHSQAPAGEWADDPKTGGCYLMSKPGDQLKAGDYMGVMGSKPRTVAFWFKDVNTPKGQWCNMVRWGKGPTGQLMELRLQQEAAFAADACNGGRVAKISPDLLLDGRWHHYVVTVSGGGMLSDMEIYIDGKPSDMEFKYARKRHRNHYARSPLNTTPGLPVMIGSDKVRGYFDEVMIWERALESEEIAQLYKATGGQKLPPLAGVAELKKAGLEGTWEVETVGLQGPLEIRLGDNGITGTIQFPSNSGRPSVKDVIKGQVGLGGNDFQFIRKIPNRGEQKWRGTLDGNKITGIWTGVGSRRPEGEAWTAKAIVPDSQKGP